ncbi:MAG TPA: transcription termination factor NusA [Candidatus Absconditabacterales bacterium]|nr:transcription termination factor NusA [Candidatus Absconditabacterales bacterium]
MKLDPQKMKDAILEMTKDYKLDPATVMDIVKLGIKTAYKKDYVSNDKKVQLLIKIGAEGDIQVYKEMEVVEEVEDDARQLTLHDAQKMNPNLQVGHKFGINITPDDLNFSRIASQAAVQTIKQRIKEIEKEKFYDNFSHRQGELLRAKVLRSVGETVILDIDNTAVVLMPSGQIPGKLYAIGEEVFVLLKKIAKDGSAITLDITQSSSDFIEALLKKVIPELEEGRVFIDKIVRIPGKRTKIVVSTSDERIDPVGVFVGQKGQRINTILTLLDGEKIDIIEYDEDGGEEKLVADALKPAKVTSVQIIGKKAQVKVPEGEKSKAIGKSASNIKLATELTGYLIEIK